MENKTTQSYWLKKTFQDVKGNPSFKRQISLVLIVFILIGTITKIPIEYIQQLVILTCACIGSVASEQFVSTSAKTY